MDRWSLWRPVGRLHLWAAGAALVVVGVGAALFAGAALLVRTGPPALDRQWFEAVNQVSPGLADWLTPVSKLFLPAGILVAVAAVSLLSLLRTRSLWPLVFAAGAAAAAWALANLAKYVADRPRPYSTVPGSILRQQPAHGSSFPSSHTAVALAVALALTPFLPRWAVIVAVAYALLVGWSRIYLGVHYPLDVAAGAGIGCAVAGAAALAERMVLLPSRAAVRSP